MPRTKTREERCMFLDTCYQFKGGKKGPQWLSGRELVSRPRVAGSSLTGANSLCP